MFLIDQAPTKPLSSYLSKFKGAVDVVESSDGSPWSHPAATKIVYDKLYSSSNYKQIKTATRPTTRRQPPRLRGNTSLRSSSTASATKPTGTSRKKSTTMPSRDPKRSPAPTTKSSSLRTSMNPPTSNANPAAANEGVASPLRRKARPLQQQQWRRQRRQSKMAQLKENPTRYQAKRTRQKDDCQQLGQEELLQLGYGRPLGRQLP